MPWCLTLIIYYFEKQDLGHEDLPNGNRVTGFDNSNYYSPQQWDVDGNSHGT